MSGSHFTVRLWNARTGEQIGDNIKVPGRPGKMVLSNDGDSIACGSKSYDYVQKWDTTTGKSVDEPMKWSEGEHMLDEMERARLCGDRKCDVVVRKDTYPIKMECRAVCPDKKKIVLGLENGNVVICERR